MHKIRRFFTVASVVLAGLISATNSRAVDFGPATAYPVGANPIGAVVGDFNGDGKPDIAVLNADSNNVSILLNNGDGTFQPAKNFDVGNSMTAIFVGDFNGDGKLDLALFLPGNPAVASDGEVRILLGNGDGSFQTPVVTTLTTGANEIAPGDFNGDKKADLILVNTDPVTSAITLNFLAGKGDGTFQVAQQIQAHGFDAVALAVADFNRDGKLDLAFSMGGSVQIVLGQGNGTFQSGVTVSVESTFSVDRIQTPDLNDDGKTDLFVDSNALVDIPCTIFHHPPCRATIHHQERFPGQGDGTFASGLVDNSLGSVVIFADFNGDGKLDAFVSASGINLGRGDGTFTPSVFSLSTLVTAATDLNNDKLADLVSLDSANNNVVVQLNSSPSSGADLALPQASASSEPVGLAQQLTYSADVLNEGPKDATGVTFSDTLPNGVNFVSATASHGTCVQSNLTVTCNVGALASGTDSVISIVVVPTAVGTITNSMNVTANETDPVPANNSATQSSTVVPVYTLTVTKTGSGSGTVRNTGLPPGRVISCGATCSAQLLSGRTIGLLATADAGDSFVSWGGACSGTLCTVTMTSDKSVTATFDVNPMLTVKFAGGGAGIIRASDGSLSCTNTDATCSMVYGPGTVVSLTAQALNASGFTSWSGACTGTDPAQCSITLNADATVTATFTPPADFTVNSTTASLSMNSGGHATEMLSFAAQGGFSGSIALACSVTGPSPLLTCGLSPASVTVGSNSASSTLTITAPAQAADLPPVPPGDSTGALPAAWMPLPSVALIGFALLSGVSNKRRRKLQLMLGLLVLGLLAACGGGGTGAPGPQAYTVTVTATSGAFHHSTTVSVTVN
jgi:uncharacterized repeat protein (TIGR01451 family)